jgi:carbonic anhydrase/acetyltransferase-like protein (isoleucine patch superfamily)
VLHTDPGFGIDVGDDVSVGHQAVLHGCSVGSGSMIGIQAVILNGASIGRNSLVAAGAVVTAGKAFPDNALIVGAPAKLHRLLTDADLAALRQNIVEYVQRRDRYRAGLRRAEPVT